MEWYVGILYYLLMTQYKLVLHGPRNRIWSKCGIYKEVAFGLIKRRIFLSLELSKNGTRVVRCELSITGRARAHL